MTYNIGKSILFRNYINILKFAIYKSIYFIRIEIKINK